MTTSTDTMKTLIETIAMSLVEDTTQVTTTAETEGDTIIINLTVAKEDMGRVIGKEGRTAKALRTILNSIATKSNIKATLKMVEP